MFIVHTFFNGATSSWDPTPKKCNSRQLFCCGIVAAPWYHGLYVSARCAMPPQDCSRMLNSGGEFLFVMSYVRYTFFLHLEDHKIVYSVHIMSVYTAMQIIAHAPHIVESRKNGERQQEGGSDCELLLATLQLYACTVHIRILTFWTTKKHIYFWRIQFGNVSQNKIYTMMSFLGSCENNSSSSLRR